MSRIKDFLKPILKPVKDKAVNFIPDKRAEKYLKKVASETKKNDRIKVGFLAFEPESWDKLQPVYEAMRTDERFDPELIVIPSYNINFSVGVKYGYELEYFKRLYPDVLTAFDPDGNLLDVRNKSYDYVFYQDPYNDHYPEGVKSYDLVQITKICYVPYGYTTLKNFAELVGINRVFFRNVFAYFPDTGTNGRIIEKIYATSIKRGLRYVNNLGFPSLEKYFDMGANANIKIITWTPRWSYDAKVGGSHFMEYKENFLELGSEYTLILRPHPMLFTNLVKTGVMSEEEANTYRNKAAEKGIEIDDRGPIDDVIEKTGILITDISSVIPSFFLTGKPVIYCDSKMEPIEEFAEMLNGIYIANSWEEVQTYIKRITSGDDYLLNERKSIIDKFARINKGATGRILDWLYKKID